MGSLKTYILTDETEPMLSFLIPLILLYSSSSPALVHTFLALQLNRRQLSGRFGHFILVAADVAFSLYPQAEMRSGRQSWQCRGVLFPNSDHMLMCMVTRAYYKHVCAILI